MSVRIVQTSTKLSPTTVSVASTGIALKSGYIRVSTGSTAAYVDIGVNPVATTNSFQIPAQSAQVFKEKVSRQVISGILTGTATTITFAENAGNPFATNDYVTIENAFPVGLNTSHNLITNWTESSITINFNSTSFSGIALTNSTVARSVKVAALPQNAAGADVSIVEVQVTSSI